MTAQHWHIYRDASAIMARLKPEDIGLNTATPAVGPKHYYWTAGEKSERLDAIRKARFEAEHGTYADAYAAGRVQEYMAAWDAVPTAADVFEQMFGEPPFVGCFTDAMSRQIAKEAVEAWFARGRRVAA